MKYQMALICLAAILLQVAAISRRETPVAVEEPTFIQNVASQFSEFGKLIAEKVDALAIPEEIKNQQKNLDDLIKQKGPDVQKAFSDFADSVKNALPQLKTEIDNLASKFTTPQKSD